MVAAESNNAAIAQTQPPTSPQLQLELEQLEAKAAVKKLAPDAVNELEKAVFALQERLAGSCAGDELLARYELERLGQRLRKLLMQLRGRRPVRRFRFNREGYGENRKNTTSSTSAAGAVVLLPLEDTGVEIKGRNAEDIELAVDAGSDVTLSDLRFCRIRITGALGVLHVQRLHHCRLHVPEKIRGSCLLFHCTSSLFLLPDLQQLRIHHTQKTLFAVGIQSGPILEDSAKLVFAPSTTASSQRNVWNQVKDFNWLRKEKSPNFELAEDESWRRLFVELAAPQDPNAGGSSGAVATSVSASKRFADERSCAEFEEWVESHWRTDARRDEEKMPGATATDKDKLNIKADLLKPVDQEDESDDEI